MKSRNIPGRAPLQHSETGFETTTNIKKLLSKCKKLTLDSLFEGVDQTLTLMDDTLFAQADKAANNAEQTLFLETMQHIRRNRSTIMRSFYQYIAEVFQQFPPGAQNKQEQSALNQRLHVDSITLLDTQSHEQMVQIANLSHRTEERCKEQLFGLEKRLIVLNNGHALTHQNNPLAPHLIVESFILAIEPVNLNTSMKSDLYRLFDEMVMKRLDEIYQNINTLLITAGVLPTLNYGDYTQKENSAQGAQAQAQAQAENAHTAEPEQPATARQQPSAPQQSSAPQQQSIPQQPSAPAAQHFTGENIPKQAAQEPLEQPGKASASAADQPFSSPFHTTGQNEASAHQLFDILSNLPQQTGYSISPGRNRGRRATDIYPELLKQLQQSGIDTGNFSHHEQQHVSSVSQLFNTITEDTLLAENFKQLFTQLSLPWALLALQSRGNLSEQLHPATLLLNEMASSASLLQGTQMLSRNLYQQCQAIIASMSESDGSGPQNMQQLLKEFQDYTSNLQRRSARQEQRNIEASQGLEALQTAREQAAASIAEFRGEQQLFPFSDKFLSTVWTDVLTFYNLRQQSAKERQQLHQLTEQLVQACSGQPQKLPELAPKIAEFLSVLGSYQQDIIQQLLAELEQENTSKVSGNLALLTPYDKPSKATSGLKKSDSKPGKPTTEKLLSRLEPGTWCHAFQDPADKNSDLGQGVKYWKFAWQSRNGQHFLFVDGAGHKAALPDRNTLCQWLEKGRIRFIEGNVPSLLTRTINKLQSRYVNGVRAHHEPA